MVQTLETVLRAGCEAGPHERRLLGDLNLNYNKLERPVADEAQPVQLKFGLTLQQIMDVVSKISLHSAHHSQPRCCLQDEKNQIITTNLWLNWVRGRCGGSRLLTLHCVPDGPSSSKV